jgi:hypothetical protein
VVSEAVPEPVRRLIAEHIDSIAQLEALLLLRATPSMWWSDEDVARALVTRPKPAELLLAHLVRHGLAEERDETYHYAATGDLGAAVDMLADAYATRRPTVIGLIFSGPDPAVSSLADAFRLRGKKR